MEDGWYSVSGSNMIAKASALDISYHANRPGIHGGLLPGQFEVEETSASNGVTTAIVRCAHGSCSDMLETCRPGRQVLRRCGIPVWRRTSGMPPYVNPRISRFISPRHPEVRLSLLLTCYWFILHGLLFFSCWCRFF